MDTESGDLAIRDLAKGEKRRLTSNGDTRQFAYFSIISPDSRLAAYAWFNEAGFYDLRVIGLDRAAPRTLFRNEEAGFVQPCAWSPDGKQILTLLFRRDNSSQIALVPAGGGSVRVLKSLNWVYPRKMDFSPDGRFIVYDESGTEEPPASSLHVLAADGSRETALVNDAGANLFPVWTPDGKNVLFASDRDGAMGLWSIPVRDGKPAGAPQRVRRELGRFLPMGITARGDYYYGLRAGQSQVCVADLDSEKITEQPVLASSSAPEWSPDGRRLAMLTRVGAENFGQESRVISIVSLESGTSRVVAPKLAYLDLIRWSPDGRELLVGGSDRSARRGLFRVDVETGATSPLLREGASTYRGLEGVWAEEGKAKFIAQGLQGVHSDLGHDPRQNFALLSPIERKDRALAQIAQGRVHPAGNATVAGRCTASGGGLRGPLQQRPPEQRHGLHHSEGHVGWAATGDPRGARPEVGGGAEAKADSSPASRLTHRSPSVGRGGRRLNPGLPTMARRKAAQLHPAIAIYRIDEEPSACVLYSNLSRFRC